MEHKVINEYDGIKIGDYVHTIGGTKEYAGVVESIIDYGEHIKFFVNVGLPMKLPCKREWIELVKKGE